MSTMLKKLATNLLKDQDFDSLAVASIDLKTKKIKCFELKDGKSVNPHRYFDLASLTKPFTLFLSYLINPKIFDKNFLLLLNHKAGLPSWGKLSKDNWKDYLKGFPIKESKAEYSDYSALRLMLELEIKTNKSLKDYCSPYWDEEIKFWKDLKDPNISPATGFRLGETIRGQVHDPNAFVIDEFCSHAGLFGTIDGVAKTLLLWEEKLNFSEILKTELKSSDLDKFVLGLDRVENQKTTLAGAGHSLVTVGHLGFTGTSFWIDLEKMKGHIILSNATQNYWYEREKLNILRRKLGEHIITASPD